MFCCNFLAAGPTVAIVDIAMSYFGPPGPNFNAQVSKVAFFFTTTALLQGVGNLVWMQLILKYGRRPVYVSSFVGYTVCAIWAGIAKSYTNELVARIVMGFFAGSRECFGSVDYSGMFSFCIRGTMMA
jgi:MFS family permease